MRYFVQDCQAGRWVWYTTARLIARLEKIILDRLREAGPQEPSALCHYCEEVMWCSPKGWGFTALSGLHYRDQIEWRDGVVSLPGSPPTP